MTTTRFLTLLGATSLGVSFFSLLVGFVFPIYQQYNSVTWWSLGIFIPLSSGMVLAGQLAAKSTNKYVFSNLIMPFTCMKRLLAMVGLVAYKKTYQPETKYFLLPFFKPWLYQETIEVHLEG